MIRIIDERGSLIAPSNETITDRTYSIIQAVHMNLFNIEESLKNPRPLLQFGLMHPELTVPSGLTPIRGEYAEKLLTVSMQLRTKRYSLMNQACMTMISTSASA